MNNGKPVKITYRVGILLMLLLGVIHISLTPVFYPGWTVDSFWFAGTGMGLVFGALGNYMNFRIRHPFSFRIALFINLLSFLFGLSLSILMPGHGPAMAVTAVSVLLVICCILLNKQK